MWKKILIIGIICLMIIPSLSLANLDVLKIDDSNVCNSSIENSPSINIDKPKEGCLYITDEETTSTIFGNTVIIDRITVKVNVESDNGISKVKFYVDDVVKSIDYDEPFEWVWDATIFGRHELKVKAYDNDGNNATDEMNVMVFNHRKNQPWPLTESNSWIRDIPTVHDFVPIGVTCEETEDHRLIYPSDDPKWRLSCFILVAMGRTPEGDAVLFQGRLPFRGFNIDRLFINGKWHSPWGFREPMYYDGEQRIYPYPTVYVFGEYSEELGGGECVGSISYNDAEREWIYKVTPLEREGTTFEVHANARGIPFWMGKQEGPYIIHGAIWNKRDVDIWGGFWDLGTFEANLTLSGKTYTFYGHFLWDRATHRVYYSKSVSGAAGAPLSFSCFSIFHKDFDIAIARSVNPSPIHPSIPFQHQGRINFPDEGEDFAFDGFKFSDNGGLQPSKYHLSGEYEGGEVNLTGEVFEFWPENWGVGTGAWWDRNGERTWGRAFIKWNGTITLHGETINIEDALGIGEFTRFEGEK